MLKIKKPVFFNASSILKFYDYFLTVTGETTTAYIARLFFSLKMHDIYKHKIENVDVDVIKKEIVTAQKGTQKVEDYRSRITSKQSSKLTPGRQSADNLRLKYIESFKKTQEADAKKIASASTKSSTISLYREITETFGGFDDKFNDPKAFNSELNYVLKSNLTKQGSTINVVKSQSTTLNTPNNIFANLNLSNISSNSVAKKILLHKKIKSNLQRLSTDRVRKSCLDLIYSFGRDPATAVTQDNFELALSLADYYLNDAIDNLRKDDVYYGYAQEETKVREKLIFIDVEIPKEFATGELDFVFRVFPQKSDNAPASDDFTFRIPIEVITKSADISTNIDAALSNKTKNKTLPVSAAQYETIDGSSMIEFHISPASYSKFNSNTSLQIRSTTLDLSANYNWFLYKNINSKSYKIYDIPQTSQGAERKTFLYRVFSYDNDRKILSKNFGSLVIRPYVTGGFDETVLLLEPSVHYSTIVTINNVLQEYSTIKVTCEDVVSGHVFTSFYEPINNRNVIRYTEQNTDADRKYIFRVSYEGNGTVVNSAVKIYTAMTDTTVYPIVTEISNFSTRLDDDGEVDLSFNIHSKFEKDPSGKNARLDEIKDILLQKGVGQQFLSEINEEKFEFSSLLTHRVSRLNLKTGLREKFGILSLDTANTVQEYFADQKITRQKNNIEKYDPMVAYVYEIEVFLRDPATLLRDAVRDVTIKSGPLAGKRYFFRPYVWRQPSTLKDGTYYSQTDEGNLIGVDLLEDEGSVGLSKTLTVPAQNFAYNLSSFRAERIDLLRVKLTWTLPEGAELNDYNHFVIVKEVNKERDIVCSTMSLAIFDDLNISITAADQGEADFGSVIYYIIPILRDFSMGLPVRSNTIIVDPKVFVGLNLTK
jgi:hypothetical protein